MSRPPSETDIGCLGQGWFGFVFPDSSGGSDCKQTFPDVHLNDMHADARIERMPRSLGSKIKPNALTSTGWGERPQSCSKSGGLAWSNAPSPTESERGGCGPWGDGFWGGPSRTLSCMPAPKGSSLPDQNHRELPTPRYTGQLGERRPLLELQEQTDAPLHIPPPATRKTHAYMLTFHCSVWFSNVLCICPTKLVITTKPHVIQNQHWE